MTICAQSCAEMSVSICEACVKVHTCKMGRNDLCWWNSTGGGATHLCGEVIRVLQTSSKQKALCSAEREREGGRQLSRFIAMSREASTEHSFNQTVTSPPGASQRLENRSLLGALPCLRFCSHAPRSSSAEAVLYPGEREKTSATTIRQTSSCLVAGS